MGSVSVQCLLKRALLSIVCSKQDLHHQHLHSFQTTGQSRGRMSAAKPTVSAHPHSCSQTTAHATATSAHTPTLLGTRPKYPVRGTAQAHIQHAVVIIPPPCSRQKAAALVACCSPHEHAAAGAGDQQQGCGLLSAAAALLATTAQLVRLPY
jgi:hypothetical protein